MNFVITSEGNWKRVAADYLTTAIVCMANRSGRYESGASQNFELPIEELFDSALFRELFIDWIVKVHFSSIYVSLITKETGIFSNETELICNDYGATSAFLLTEEKNSEVI